MKVSDMIKSKFLRKSDVEDEPVMTITGISLEDLPGDSGEKKWALSFAESDKLLALNNTMLKVLEKTYGDDTDSWEGRKVIVYFDENVTYKGQLVGGIRLRPMKAKAAPAAASRPASPMDHPPGEPFSDDIPFGNEERGVISKKPSF